MKQNDNCAIGYDDEGKFIGKKHPKKPFAFAIECQHHQSFMARKGWRVYAKYLHEKDALKAFSQFKKNKCYFREDCKIEEYKGKSCPNEILHFCVIYKGKPWSSFRLIKLEKK